MQLGTMKAQDVLLHSIHLLQESFTLLQESSFLFTNITFFCYYSRPQVVSKGFWFLEKILSHL